MRETLSVTISNLKREGKEREPPSAGSWLVDEVHSLNAMLS